MYSIDLVKQLVTEKTNGTAMFLVEVTISKDNKICVFLDSQEGISIDDCVGLTRHLEANLDREKEDYELEVSSAGIGYPFKVEQQYINNLGKEVELVLKNGEKLNGIMKSFDNGTMVLETHKKKLLEGKKRKQWVKEDETIHLEQIKTTKLLLSI
jgi:ribosome maturation factor RimP